MNTASTIFVISWIIPPFLTALIPLGQFSYLFPLIFREIKLMEIVYIYRYIQKYYLHSSRELKRLESISKSPIYAQFSETLAGKNVVVNSQEFCGTKKEADWYRCAHHQALWTQG